MRNTGPCRPVSTAGGETGFRGRSGGCRMEGTVGARAATVDFWNDNAPWYRLWMEHTRYHERILDVLTAMAAPRWKVLDIGAGNGVLSMPLCAIGCEVTALEPSKGMRDLLSAEASKRGIGWLRIDDRPWEAVPLRAYRGLDLVVACNSLHVTGLGLARGLERIFQLGPKRVFLVSELHAGLEVAPPCSDYRLILSLNEQVESSFAYHHLRQAKDHWSFKKGGKLSRKEVRDLAAVLTYHDEHYWVRERALLGMFWWERRDLVNKTRRQ
jgi:hypothetical protein